MTTDIDTTADKYLRDKYAIIGVGETTYTRGSGMTTRALGTWAIKNAMDDAGIPASEIDGMMSYSGNDSTASPMLAGTSASGSTSTWTSRAVARRPRH